MVGQIADKETKTVRSPYIIYDLKLMFYTILGFIMCMYLIKLYYSIFMEVCKISKIIVFLFAIQK